MVTSPIMTPGRPQPAEAQAQAQGHSGSGSESLHWHWQWQARAQARYAGDPSSPGSPPQASGKSRSYTLRSEPLCPLSSLPCARSGRHTLERGTQALEQSGSGTGTVTASAAPCRCVRPKSASEPEGHRFQACPPPTVALLLPCACARSCCFLAVPPPPPAAPSVPALLPLALSASFLCPTSACLL